MKQITRESSIEWITLPAYINKKALTMCALRNDRQVPSSHHGTFPCHIVAPLQVVHKRITGLYKWNDVCDTELLQY